MLSPNDAPQSHTGLQARRRQLRRGTHSCWECKRRKMKCVFDLATNATACKSCRRRGSPCLSQQFAEDSAVNMEMVAKLNNASSRVESISTVNHSTTSTANTVPGPHSDNPLTPISMTLEPPGQQAFHKMPEQYRSVDNTPVPASQSKLGSLSRFLHGSLPSREDTEAICRAIPQRPVLAHEMMTMPYTCLYKNDRTQSENSLEVPDSSMHPVLIARHMLLLANVLQHLHPDVHTEIKGLSETPRAMSERLADLAINCVTTKDELIGSIEGLECIMIESVYQANLGNLRRSWVAGRRAVSVAQLMGLNRSDNRAQYEVLDSRNKLDSRIMWSRIVFLDRFLCLLLGLPQGCTEQSMGSEAMLTADLPMARLERVHCIVASRILERNEFEPSTDDLSITRTLDLELQEAARSVPSKWWLTPKLESAGTDPQALFWNTGRLFAQVLHYNLLNQLHLPYMLRSSMADRKYEYSRITCVNASREVLTRFNTLRSFNGIASSCRIIDFLALMAAMTLLLAHLDSHLSRTENFLAHQYHSDRAMIEQVQENFQEVNSLNSDALSAHSANLLRRLLAIDAERPDGFPQCAGRVSVHKSGTDSVQSSLNDEGAVSVHIPYFGIIRIACQGSSTTQPESQSTMGRANRPAQPQAVDMFNEISPQSSHAYTQMRPRRFDGPQGTPNTQSTSMGDTSNGPVKAPIMMPEIYTRTQTQSGALSMQTSGAVYSAMHFAPHNPDILADSLLRNGEYPGLTAGAEDWAFQGADLAFFDNFMRTMGSDGNGIADRTTVGELSMDNDLC